MPVRAARIYRENEPTVRDGGRLAERITCSSFADAVRRAKSIAVDTESTILVVHQAMYARINPDGTCEFASHGRHLDQGAD